MKENVTGFHFEDWLFQLIRAISSAFASTSSFTEREATPSEECNTAKVVVRRTESTIFKIDIVLVFRPLKTQLD